MRDAFPGLLLLLTSAVNISSAIVFLPKMIEGAIKEYP